jgi:ubiquinone/menaquinone biosynthesis C-methylase UbiE
MEAFTDNTTTIVKRAYEELKPAELSWSFATAGVELCKLVIDNTIPRGSLVVDLGCGPGTEAVFLAAHGMSVIGIDRMPNALRTAAGLAGHYGVKVSWVLGDILAVPLAAGSADVVNDSFIFHNLRDEARPIYAQEVWRLLRPNGLFVLRGFSDRMEPGSGPRRLSSEEILTTFMPYLKCEHLSLFRNFSTEKRPEQWHWLALWRRHP